MQLTLLHEALGKLSVNKVDGQQLATECARLDQIRHSLSI